MLAALGRHGQPNQAAAAGYGVVVNDQVGLTGGSPPPEIPTIAPVQLNPQYANIAIPMQLPVNGEWNMDFHLGQGISDAIPNRTNPSMANLPTVVGSEQSPVGSPVIPNYNL